MPRAARMQVLADKCPPVFGELLNRPVVCMQVESRNSPGAPYHGVCGVGEPLEAPSLSNTYSEGQCLESQCDGGAATQYGATSEMHDDMVLVVLQMLPRQLPTDPEPQAHFPSLPSAPAVLPTSRPSACSCLAVLPRESDGTVTRTRPASRPLICPACVQKVT